MAIVRSNLGAVCMQVYRGAEVEVTTQARHDPAGTLVVLGGALGDVVLRLPVLRLLGPARVLAPRDWGAMLVEVGMACQGDRLDDPRFLSLWSGDAHPPDERLRGLRRAVLTVRDPVLREGLVAALGAVLAPDPDPPAGVHQAIHLLTQLGESVEGPEAIPVPLLPVSPRWTERALALYPDVLDALIVPGSGGLGKCWPAADYVRLVAALRRRGQAPVVMLGPDELERGWSAERFDAPCLLAPGLRETAALLARAAVVVGNDAGTSHLAAAVGAPVVALFGPTDPARWRPVGRRVRVLRWTADRPVDVDEVLAEIDAYSSTRQSSVQPRGKGSGSGS